MSSLIININHMEPIFQDLTSYCSKKVPKYHNQFVTFVPGVKPTFWWPWGIEQKSPLQIVSKEEGEGQS